MHCAISYTYRLVFVFLILSQFSFGQLDDFNLTLSAVEESCAGNGTISMSVSGTTNGSSITYNLFLLPDTDNPIAQTTSSSFDNLESGAYLVQAIQTLDDLQNSQSADITVNNSFSPLDFEIIQVPSDDCGSDSLTINALSGNPEHYEILSGPVVAPLQESNTFNNLPDGTYVIRVFDECGNALTKTYTLVSTQSSYSITSIEIPDIVESCDETTISYSIVSSGTNLSYPLVVNYQVNSLEGTGSISFSETFENGPESQLEIIESITNFGDEVFEIEIEIMDQCGNLVTNSEIIDPNPVMVLNLLPELCGNNLRINVSNYLPPFTLEFTEAPAGFNAADFNDNGAVYSESSISFELEDTGLPEGIYSILLTDSCGRSDTGSVEIIEEIIEPIITTNNRGCDPLRGELSLIIPSREIVSAQFLDAPEAYENELPDDLSEFILSNTLLLVSDIVKGPYVLQVEDNCGNIFTEDIIIPDLEDLPLNVSSSPNCTSDTGSLRIAGSYGTVESVIITQAPEEFSFTLPFNYSDAIQDSGVFFVDDLPVGNYTVEFTDSCGNEFQFNQSIDGYISDPSVVNLQRNCGSFDLTISDSDNSVSNVSYWFQKYYEVNDSWGHPETGILYNEGELPNTANAISIQNGETLLNIFYTGTFRIIKSFQSISNSDTDEFCLDIFPEFNVESELLINDVFSLNCDGGSGPSDLIVDVLGVPPYTYSIIAPEVINNGDNNIFTGLDPGVYDIRVEDACGSIAAITINLLDLPPLVEIGIPADIVVCTEVFSNQALFNLADQNSTVLGNQNPDNYTVTYHLSQSDANSGFNPLPGNFENSTNPQTIYARVINNNLDICYETASFQLIVGTTPDLGPNESLIICEDETLVLSAGSGYSSYEWSTGETTRDIEINEGGIYTVAVNNEYGDSLCSATKTFTVTTSGTAIIEAVSTVDFTVNNNSINIEVTGLGNYEYSLDGIVYQDENIFTGLSTGDYTIFVRDKNGCGIVTQSVSLLGYKRFFTPNGDGTNDFWQISGSQFEPNLQVSIFDRYGKLLTAFAGDQRGWDGTYNGLRMPASDYWFLVTRIDGKTHVGHFALKR